MKRFLLLSLLPALALSSCKPKSPDQAEGGGGDAEAAGNAAPSPDNGYVLFTGEVPRTPGEVITVTEVMKMTAGNFSMEAPQGTFEGKIDMTGTKEFRLETESPEKVKATITRNDVTQKVMMNGQEMPQAPQKKPLVDVPLLVTLGDGEWTGAPEDGSTIDDFAAVELDALVRKVAREDDGKIYGDGPRKPGDQWTVDAAEAMMLKDASDVAGILELTFDKLGDHEGIECAFLSGTFDMKGSPPEGPGGGEGSMSLKGTFSIIRSLEHQLDLFRELDGEMKLEMKTPMGTMKMSGPTTITETAVVGK